VQVKTTYPDLGLLDSILEGDGMQHLALEQRIFDTMQECLAGKGYEYPARRATEADALMERPVLPTLSVERAAEFGYHNPTRFGSPAVDTYAAYVESLTDAERTAYYAAEAACFEHSNDLNFADYDRYVDLQEQVQKARSEMLSRFEASEQLADLNASWSACMSKAGYNYAEPSEASDATFEEVLAQREIDTAKQDASCRVGLNYDAEYRTIRVSFEQELLDKNSNLVLALYEAKYAQQYDS